MNEKSSIKIKVQDIKWGKYFNISLCILLENISTYFHVSSLVTADGPTRGERAVDESRGLAVHRGAGEAGAGAEGVDPGASRLRVAEERQHPE